MINPGWTISRSTLGAYDPSCFALVDQGEVDIGPGEVLVESLLLSLDPTHLNWAKLDPALQYMPVREGDLMLGNGIGVVRRSRADGYEPGQVITGLWRWARYCAVDARYIRPALAEAEMPYPEQMTILSHVGRAAAGGLLAVGKAQPGDAVLVSAAAGATGAIAAQLAKNMGCRTIGIAGGAAKCRYLVEDLGLDGAIDYKEEDLDEALGRHFPEGIDLFFDNVGGLTLDAALLHMAHRCRIVMCGAISQYDASGGQQERGIRNLPMLIFREASMLGYVAGDFDGQGADLDARLLDLYRQKSLKVQTHVVPFADIPQALNLLLSGKNAGKLMARL
ncbi:MDR family NADP-dependent oxidoreductase [Sphingomonas bisphenolicum]|uniref:NADP-dependent oxidoreductase n=1 Tax=Sphingomonas bisphenolicum TaxID=296544 RepID=A0ABM7G428_9SPHN|nr:NADP-dependent oxidoreductase [Sphingomonas bisphenolicum]BBF71989.1 NADP-dependent oxidoreductase [Sphingomonas bisphenolicum]